MPELTINVRIAESGDLDATAQRIGQKISGAASRGGGGSSASSGSRRKNMSIVGLPTESEVKEETEKIFRTRNASTNSFYDSEIAANMRVVSRIVQDRRKLRDQVGDPDAFGTAIARIGMAKTIPESSIAAVRAMTAEQKAVLGLQSSQAMRAGKAMSILGPPAEVEAKAIEGMSRAQRATLSVQSRMAVASGAASSIFAKRGEEAAEQFGKGWSKSLESGVGRDMFRALGVPFGTARGLGGLVSAGGIGLAVGAVGAGLAAYAAYSEYSKYQAAQRTTGADVVRLGLSGAANGNAGSFIPQETGGVMDLLGVRRLPWRNRGAQNEGIEAAALLTPNRTNVGSYGAQLAAIAGARGGKAGDISGDILPELAGLNRNQSGAVAGFAIRSRSLAQGGDFAGSESAELQGQSLASFYRNVSNRNQVVQSLIGKGQVGAIEGLKQQEEQQATSWEAIQQAGSRTALAQLRLTDDPSTRATVALTVNAQQKQTALTSLDKQGQVLNDTGLRVLGRLSATQEAYDTGLEKYRKGFYGNANQSEEAFQKDNSPEGGAALLKRRTESEQQSQAANQAVRTFRETKKTQTDEIDRVAQETSKQIETERKLSQGETDLANIRAAGASIRETRAAQFDIPGVTSTERFNKQSGDIELDRQTLEAEIAARTRKGDTQEAARLGSQRGTLSMRGAALGEAQGITSGQGIRTGTDYDPVGTSANAMRQRDQDAARGKSYRDSIWRDIAKGGYTDPYRQKAATDYLGSWSQPGGGGGMDQGLNGATAALATFTAALVNASKAPLPSGGGGSTVPGANK